MSKVFSRRRVLGGAGAAAAGLVGGVGGAALVATPAHALGAAFAEVSKIMDGQTPNVQVLLNRMGPSNPLNMFTSGGSQNIAVVARGGLYLWGDNPPRDRAWLEEYYLLMENSGSPWFLDREIFSGVYTQAVVGIAMAVRQHAIAQGDINLQWRAFRFLRRYWAYLALAAMLPAPTTAKTYTRCGTQTFPARATNLGWGYNLGLVGSRTASPIGGDCGGNFHQHGMQGNLLAMALNHPNRDISGNLNNSPGWWGGVRAAVRAAGYTVPPSGLVNLQSMSVSAFTFGMDAADRPLLRDFIATKGQNGTLSDVVDILHAQGVSQVRANITIVRSVNRVTSWWGISTGQVQPPGDAKGGPWFAVQARANGTTHYVSRSNARWGSPTGGLVYREGNNICAEGPLPKICVTNNILSGGFIYEVRLSPGGTQIIAEA